MPTYAKETSVSPDRSRAEIEQTLARYGATQFMYGWNGHAAVIAFEMHDRRLRFVLPLPARDDPAFAQTPTGRRRTQAQSDKAYDQAVRQRWRALALAIKAKLEMVESGITGFEQEFLAHVILPSGQTVGEWMAPQVEQAYVSGRMPPLLPPPMVLARSAGHSRYPEMSHERR